MKTTMRNVLLVLLISLSAGCQTKSVPSSESVVRYAENQEITGKEKQELIGSVHPGLFTEVDRANSEARETAVPVVPKTGETITLPPGRYMIAGNPTGNIYVLDKDGKQILREIVGDYAGAHTLTVSVDESMTVRADGGYDSVSVFPAETEPRNTLSAGVWKVGTDIDPGVYTISTDELYGYLQILERGKDPILYELIGGTSGKTESRVELREGQWLRVTKTSTVVFNPAD
ncbi:hypothetical protein [Sporosarcina trichiuri]|uniref:hypothetical protein n=1 Tax=Sporosarcina trichiuri TaxID=3056445 RepID=UPI0025B581A0|nr:hypothetical protein [Sporosarcina sp. 0.2-SM1T-5]WJY26698.1 hypothetical protein QWT68_11510 [Sporosarcina sp. 0.2-SM1T-5]